MPNHQDEIRCLRVVLVVVVVFPLFDHLARLLNIIFNFELVVATLTIVLTTVLKICVSNNTYT